MLANFVLASSAVDSTSSILEERSSTLDAAVSRSSTRVSDR
jgi:hypothetical protein